MAEDDHRKALDFWEKGYRLQQKQDLDGAIECYERSIELSPTAEAHTFLGWALSSRGDFEGAIAHCHRAIEIDPSFGNPYNDIGAYLIEQGRLDEAVDWLERAKHAPRYEPRHFPYMNLSRVYAAQGKVTRAIAELERALELAPGDSQIITALARLRTLN